LIFAPTEVTNQTLASARMIGDLGTVVQAGQIFSSNDTVREGAQSCNGYCPINSQSAHIKAREKINLLRI
jgi:hypothetical protein